MPIPKRSGNSNARPSDFDTSLSEESLSVDEQLEEDLLDEADESETAVSTVVSAPSSSVEKASEGDSSLFDDPEPLELEDDSTEVSADEGSGKAKKKGKGGKKTSIGGGKEQPIEIDTKKKKLKPVGSQKRIRVSDLDARKDLRANKFRVQTAVLVLVGGLFAFGAYNAIFPEKPHTDEEIAMIALEVTGASTFPVEGGEGFATDFMEAYLTLGDDPVRDRVLNYYYTGSMDATSSSSGDIGVSASSTFQQEIIYGPTVYESRAVRPSSGNYVIGALVQDTALDSEGNTIEPPIDGSNAHWVFFNVNVYYDEANNTYSITPDSPTLVSPNEAGATPDVPDAVQLGSGARNSDLEESLNSLVNGFIQGYASTTPNDYSSIEQYIVSNPPPALTQGLGGEYQVAEGNRGVTFEAYPDNETGEVKVRVIVQWERTATGSTDEDSGGGQNREATVTYTSQYVMTLVPQGGDGRYLVSNFAPEYYIEDLDD